MTCATFFERQMFPQGFPSVEILLPRSCSQSSIVFVTFYCSLTSYRAGPSTYEVLNYTPIQIYTNIYIVAHFDLEDQPPRAPRLHSLSEMHVQQ